VSSQASSIDTRLVVHSLNTEGFHLKGKPLGAVRLLMPTATIPGKGMLVGIPIGGGRPDGFHDLVPAFKALSFKARERNTFH
jgi:hypothetical protein